MMASPSNAEAIESALAKPGYIPSGVTAAYLEESRDPPTVVAILFVGALVYFIMLLRCCARLSSTPRPFGFGLDDWLACLTLAPYTAVIALAIVLIHMGSGRHFLYIQFFLTNETINETQILDFVAHLLYTTALLICRLSGLAFYARIVRRHKQLTWTVRAAAAFMIVAFIPQLFLIIFHCVPVTGIWPYGFQAEASRFKCLAWGVVYVTNGTISLVCDLILFTIPASIIQKLKVSPSNKIKLACVLMPGLLVIAISAVRMYLIIDSQWVADESWAYDPFLAIEISEIGLTLIALSIPALKPFLGSVFGFLDRALIANTDGPTFRAPKPDTRPVTEMDVNHDVTTRDLNKWSRGNEQNSLAITIQSRSSSGATQQLPNG